MMKFTSAKNKNLHKTALLRDSNDLTRSAFELFYVFVIVIFALAIVFSAFFRIVTFRKSSNGNAVTYSVVSVPAVKEYKRGDIVSVSLGGNVSVGKVIALEGEDIIIGININDSVNCVVYDNVRYFSSEELEQKLKERVVPDGYIMLDGDIMDSQELHVGELVRKADITGKVGFVIYPFSLFGKNLADDKN